MASGNIVDPIRHIKVFNPSDLNDMRVDIVGVGATGSRIALSLAKLGIQHIHIWDFDIVEPHNIANQAFGLSDCGKPKVEALAAIIKAQTGLDVTAHNEKVTGRTSLGNIVFLLTDTMASRKEIWDGAIRFKPQIQIMIETRMGVDEGRVYNVRPTIPADVDFWSSTLCDDKEAAVSVCGSSISVGPTAELVSAMASWTLLNWWDWRSKDKDRPHREVIFSVRPPTFLTRA